MFDMIVFHNKIKGRVILTIADVAQSSERRDVWVRDFRLIHPQKLYEYLAQCVKDWRSVVVEVSILCNCDLSCSFY
jgi:hypothetical protein